MKTPLFVSFFVLTGGVVGVFAQAPQTPSEVQQLQELKAQAEMAAERAYAAEVAARRKAEAAAAASAIPLPTPAPFIAPAPPPPTGLATTTLPGDIRFTAQSISESRSTQGVGSINISYVFSGPNIDTGSLVRQARVTRAVDNQDRSLVAAPRGGSSLSPFSMSSQITSMLRSGAPQLRGNLSIGGSVRDAVSVKVVEGEIELFVPSEMNGSVMIIQNAFARAGKPFDDEIFKRYGIEFTLATAETWPAMQAANPTLASRAAPAFTTSVFAFVKDPQQRFAGFTVQDGAGNMLPSGGFSSGSSGPQGSYTEQRMNGTVPREIQLVMYIVTPESLTTIPFKLENIQLP